MDWKYYNTPKFEYEYSFNDLSLPWAGHKYFAYDLVRNVKPKKIVELGTYKGTSFFSFCQAIKDAKSDCEIFAVDTWSGDEHAGFYGDDIFNEVKKIKDEYYYNVKARFLRKTFDQALSEFEDCSIDILHIDGLHTYEAVKHDFESWIPKMKETGIVLFHDIVVTRDDFGVFDLWKELKKNYETMEFHYSYGLGILFIGRNNSIFTAKDKIEPHYSFLIEDIENGKIDSILKAESILKNKVIQKKIQELRKVKNNLNLKNEELQRINWEINIIKSSKFWKLRDWYLKFKFLLFSPRKFFKKYFQKAKYFGNLFFMEAKVGGIRGASKMVFNYVFPKISTSSSNDIGTIDKSVTTPLSEINKILIKEGTKKFVLNDAVDVIIPVYNGIEFLPKLFESIFKNTTTLYRLIIIDDCSSDRSVIPFLKKIKKDNSKIEIVLIENKNNLGFVRSVNKAVKYTKNHFVLLNTDVEVPYGWLERLMYPIFSDTKVASTTPFTNSGTICSFPETLKDNDIFEGLTVDKVDYYFSKLVFDKYPSVPTGVGFCMGCNKDVVAKIGMFDAESFSKGYGEENDWCQRAIREGYKNVIVPNLFVYHKHGGSFSTDEKKRLINENSKKLLCRYPEYDRDIQKFIVNDPLKKFREAMILRISIHENDKKLIVFFDHELGGGANYFRQKYINEIIENGESVILVTYCIKTKEYHVAFYYKKYFELFSSSDLNDVFKFINIAPISKINISELVSYDDPLTILSFVQSLKMEKNIKLSIFVHDYFSICPKVFLLNNLKEYCGVENINNCQKCLDQSEADLFTKEKNSKKWRNTWFNFISTSDELICFSSSSKEILMRAYPKLDEKNILVKPHSVDYIKPLIVGNKKPNNQLTIGILGGISYIKGSEIIKKMLDIIESEKINARVIIIGEFSENVKNRNLVVTGKYNRNDIVDRVVENKIDVFFVPSIIPETFSYTAEEIMKMNFPLAVFNLGAPVERVVKYEKGVIINKIDAKIALDEIIKLSKKYENI